MADSGCLRVSQVLVNKASGDSVLQVLGNTAQKNCQIVPVLPVYRRGVSWAGGGGGGEGLAGCLRKKLGGGGQNIFLSGPKFPAHVWNSEVHLVGVDIGDMHSDKIIRHDSIELLFEAEMNAALLDGTII